MEELKARLSDYRHIEGEELFNLKDAHIIELVQKMLQQEYHRGRQVGQELGSEDEQYAKYLAEQNKAREGPPVLYG